MISFCKKMSNLTRIFTYIFLIFEKNGVFLMYFSFFMLIFPNHIYWFFQCQINWVFTRIFIFIACYRLTIFNNYSRLVKKTDDFPSKIINVLFSLGIQKISFVVWSRWFWGLIGLRTVKREFENTPVWRSFKADVGKLYLRRVGALDERFSRNFAKIIYLKFLHLSFLV